MQVTALNIYPIKSCAGIALEQANVERRGLQFDRRFMLVDENGRFQTQRQLPQMTLLQPAIDGDQLCITRPDGDQLRVELQPQFAESIPVRIWRSELDASVADDSINAWFSDALEHPVRLVYMADHQQRLVSRDRATQAGDEVSFADGAPILLIGEASLADLNARLSTPVSMTRFRPNIVIDTDAAFAEDSWRHIRIGATPLEVAWSCARCTIPTIDPLTGEVDAGREPSRTLREYRRKDAAVLFGQNVLTRGDGVIRVGDPLEVVESV